MLAAALVFFLSGPLSAAQSPLCVVKSSSTAAAVSEPGSLDALLECQSRKLRDLSAAYQVGRRKPPPAAMVDRWQESQREEVREFLNRQPDAAAPGESEAKAPGTDADFKKLESSLREKSDGGKKGLTPEAASDIRKYLLEQQGSISPDMQDLLNSAEKDGVNLSDGTMKKIKDAARQAKDAGLDLGVKPEIEQGLLEK